MKDHEIKDHEIAALVNELTRIAKCYYGAQQLREQISRTVVGAVKRSKENDKGIFVDPLAFSTIPHNANFDDVNFGVATIDAKED
jgi:hypothetical protein